MKGALAASAALHAAVLAASLLTWRARPAPPFEEATIEVVFGRSAVRAGSPAPMAGAPATQAAAPADVAAGGGAAGGEAAAPAASAAPSTAGEAPAVHLDGGELGLDVPVRDPHMISAKAGADNRPPVYPRDAGLREGVVTLRLLIDPDGRVASVLMLQSSGTPALDRAAREALSKWHFLPALRDGVAVPSYRDQSVNFTLGGR